MPQDIFHSSRTLNRAVKARNAKNERLRSARVEVEERRQPEEFRSRSKSPFENEADLRDFVESRILESMRAGEFDNLRGKGRPLPELPRNALEYAMRIMRENSIRPPWMQLMHDIDEEKRSVRKYLANSWAKFMPDKPHRWEMAVGVAQVRIESINKSVDTFNLTRPQCVAHLFRLRLRINEEIERARQTAKQNNADLLRPTNGSQEDRTEQASCVTELKSLPWKRFARFLRAEEVKEYDLPTWGRRRQSDGKDTPS